MSTPRSSTEQKGPNACLPFAGVVGNDLAGRALMLIAVDPGLKGVLISGSSGTGKSVLARSLTSLLPATADHAAVPFIELPLNSTEDRLLGGIDIERTVSAGTRNYSAGLLAEADGGVLLVDDINLLDEGLSAHVAAALESGQLRVEREGVSKSHSADFLLMGTYNPEEGEVSPLLRDRIGLLVDCAPNADVQERAEITGRAFSFQENLTSLLQTFDEETLRLKRAVEEARQRLDGVRLSSKMIRNIARVSLRLGIEGNRADIFATRAARAHAALSARDEISEEDIVAAIQLVLLPRATTLPATREPEEPADAESDPEDGDRGAIDEPHSGATRDLIIQALDAVVTFDVMTSSARSPRRAVPGKRVQGAGFREGRYVRSVERRSRDCNRVAIDATLRTAAPYQRSRRELGAGSTAGLKITGDDLRYKKLRRRSGMLFIFLVDTSGSMVLNRMAQAKGALTRLLQEAYLHRDRVALIGFRGPGAELLLAPTRSVELGKRLVDVLPAGGATPLAAGLVKAHEVARAARLQEGTDVMLLVFTDGRANVGLRIRAEKEAAGRAEGITDELRQIGTLLQLDQINSVVIDTKSRFVSSGEGRSLAEFLGGRYLYLPRADERAIYDAVTAAARQVRRPRAW
jgi:magnesium chelatase subunit D